MVDKIFNICFKLNIIRGLPDPFIVNHGLWTPPTPATKPHENITNIRWMNKQQILQHIPISNAVIALFYR